MTVKNAIPHLIAMLGAMFALFGANAGCLVIFHQPEKPDLSKLRKF
ncbi:MAG: cyclic lactone autoinducer peptide [Lachnospiraceae bacterium]|nr:cyclic lactone autoinducer peptide [Lachnospiraceae bacterium]